MIGADYLGLPDKAEEEAKVQEAQAEATKKRIWDAIQARAKKIKRKRKLRNKYHCTR